MDPIADRMRPEARKEWQDLKDSGYARLRLAHEIYMQHIHGEVRNGKLGAAGKGNAGAGGGTGKG